MFEGDGRGIDTSVNLQEMFERNPSLTLPVNGAGTVLFREIFLNFVSFLRPLQGREFLGS